MSKIKFSLSSTGCNRAAVSCGLISTNQSVLWQNAPKWVSASKGLSLWMSNRQLFGCSTDNSAQHVPFMIFVVEFN